jgi:hypothetical protein
MQHRGADGHIDVINSAGILREAASKFAAEGFP